VNIQTHVPEDYDHPDVPRCSWVPPDDQLYCYYHDTEWGRPIYESKALFSKLIQDGQQAGLSWITILRKRDNLLKAYDGFDPDIVAHYGPADILRLLDNPGLGEIQGRARQISGIGSPVQRFEKTRVQICRPCDPLCLYASRRHDQRPQYGLSCI